MRRKWRYILLPFVLFTLVSGCSSNKQETKKQASFSNEAVEKLKEKAAQYSEQEFQEGEVPLNTFVQISGTILKSDSGEQQLKKGDRFILSNGDSQYQVFNEQENSFEVGEDVTVYGEYYGFLKGILIEKDGNRNVE
ncbi:hypothetical protein [Candidatus Enterococcus clewellii]|uniref:Lipoprotein n=1 Tax=Candidatus Enterococcus clewellii TaxID=1834193 RepID=A0A242KCI1_9ENTE|nr:hypothetical protein [Enterococcus sp. 9E7_DIV0242]OTP18767.1 hypothetical protein A5888_000581 [Enterococcus sp. 9E7_DIV0242]